VRVYPFLQGCGIGARLLRAAERAVRERGCAAAEVGVEKDNPRARRLYERLGYHAHGERVEEFGYDDWNGTPVRVRVDQWMLRKPVAAAAPVVRVQRAAAR
jgi:ribosomal protein S18 acetylase RimI-like enzyme